jgi:LysR family transcriptional regulator, glycine cleavage system transcriptional activator
VDFCALVGKKTEMSRFTPSLKALRSFEAAARLESLTRAAEELHVSVSAVAFQVRQVEEGLGMKLLRRSGRGLALTAEGRRLAGELTPAFRRIDAATERFRRPAQLSGPVFVSMLANFASLWLLPRLHRFRERFPGVEVRILTSSAHVDFAAEGVDCAIRCGPGGWPGLRAEPLFPQRLAPLCHPGHEAARLNRLPPDRELIANSVHPSEWAEWFASAGVDRDSPDRAHAFEGRELVADAVRAGIGVGLLDISIFADSVEAGELVRIGPAIDTGWSHYVVRPDSAASAAGETFIDWLKMEAAEGGLGAPPAFVE